MLRGSPPYRRLYPKPSNWFESISNAMYPPLQLATTNDTSTSLGVYRGVLALIGGSESRTNGAGRT